MRGFVIATALLLTNVCASASDSGSSLVPLPIKPTKATECVEPTELMRRNHMEFLDHQRDATVIDGIRTQKHSLVECINCHVQADEYGKVARSDNPEHFCAGCHMFTGVKIDCFECHADRPVDLAYRHKLNSDSTHHRLSMRRLSTKPGLSSEILNTLFNQLKPGND